MSRTTALKIGYVVALLVLALIAGGAIWALGGSITAFLVVALLFLVPGRIQGIFFRDLFRGRRLLAEGDVAQSIAASQQFLAQVRNRPWQKNLIWLAGTLYTTDVEAMALNNIGTAHLHSGEFEQAQRCFREALALDGQYPLPLHNLAVIAEIALDREQARELFAAARDRGFANSSMDQVVSAAQALLASIEGRGVPSSRA